jgi:3-carboxy-cis,cis-muconate cycloisomerase
LFSGVFAAGGVAERVSDRAWLQAMLDFEAALARACARTRLIPAEAAAQITAACRADEFDLARIGRDSEQSGNPAIPMLAELRGRLPEAVAGHVHRGATSQDVIDTAAMLMARRALEPLLADAAAAGRACSQLAASHRDAPMIARTLLKQAVPSTFGLKAAGWLAGIGRSRRELAAVAEREIALQFGGAAGNLSALGDAGLQVAQLLADELELPLPALPWHAERTRPVALVDALGRLAGALGKVARDIALLAQDEVAEVRIAGGGSSAMPHKQNPVAAVAVQACAQRMPGLVATMHLSLAAEHERAAGAWHAEWETFADAFALTGSAAAWARRMLDGLEVDGARMERNLEAAGDVVMAESVTTAIAERLGDARARELVTGALSEARGAGSGLRAALERRGSGGLTAAELDAALSPRTAVSAAGALVDRALAEYGEG